jgi:predicted proteasome-type protease
LTLIAGFKCQRGIVLCAGTEENSGVAKYAAEKLEMYEREWCRVGIGGAGNYRDLIDATVTAVTKRLDRDKPMTPHLEVVHSKSFAI